jgi:hypothetical protein
MPIEDKAVEELANTTRHYLDQILLAPLSEVGLLARDQISFWRFKNQVKMVGKAQKLIQERKLSPESVKNSVLPEQIVPLIEEGSNAADPELNDMFAKLLASAIDPKTKDLVHPSYAKIVAQLSPLEARIIKTIYEEITQYEQQHPKGTQGSRPGVPEGTPVYRVIGAMAENIGKRFDVSSMEVDLSFSNLRRLGICDRGRDSLNEMNQVRIACLTEFGKHLLSIVAE